MSTFYAESLPTIDAPRARPKAQAIRAKSRNKYFASVFGRVAVRLVSMVRKYAKTEKVQIEDELTIFLLQDTGTARYTDQHKLWQTVTKESTAGEMGR